MDYGWTIGAMNPSPAVPAPVPDVLWTSLSGPVSTPSWMRGVSVSRKTAGQFQKLKKLPAMTVVQAYDLDAVLNHTAFLDHITSVCDQNDRIVFLFKKPAPQGLLAGASTASRLLARFPSPARVEYAPEASGLTAIQAAVARLLVENSSIVATPPVDPLAGMKSVLAATSDLRSKSGRLQASKVARTFGLAVADLANLMGRARQTVSKTPDAPALQESLGRFERIARLRAVLPEAQFRAWLNHENRELGRKTPIAAIRAGRADVVASLADDMLTGTPA